MDSIDVDGHVCEGVIFPTEQSAVLMLRAKSGVLACGYLSVACAERLGDALAIGRGVHSYDDMLAAVVQEVSPRAAELGVQPGCSGKDALLAMS